VAWVIQNRMIAEDLAARSRISLSRQESDSSGDEVLSRPKWAELRQSERALSRHAGTRADLRGRTGARHARQACARVGPYGQLRCCGRARALAMPGPGPAPSFCHPRKLPLTCINRSFTQCVPALAGGREWSAIFP
jgi:hypothetical protein